MLEGNLGVEQLLPGGTTGPRHTDALVEQLLPGGKLPLDHIILMLS